MAKYLAGALASGIRGSVGGVTFSAVAGRSRVVKLKALPTNPRSAAQTLLRSAFANAAAVWNTLAGSVRLDWDDYASGLSRSDAMGDYSADGRQTFMGNYAIAQYVEEQGAGIVTPGTAAPSATGFLDIGPISSSVLLAPGTGFSINVTNNSGEAVVVWITLSRAFGVSRQKFSGPFQANTFVEAAVPDTNTSVIAFDALIDGGIYFAEVHAISAAAPLRVATPSIVRCISSVVV